MREQRRIAACLDGLPPIGDCRVAACAIPQGRCAVRAMIARRDESGDVTWKGRKMNKDWKDATKHADLERVRWLVENGADINSKDEYGQTALMNAAHRGQVEFIRLLIEKGADLNTTAKYKLSALMLALIAGHPDVARLLIEAGADVNLRSNMNFYGALHLAENAGYSEIVALLKQKGATS